MNNRDMRAKLFKGYSGCSDHNCIVTGKQLGMGTNGGCKCLVNAGRMDLTIIQSRLSKILEEDDDNSSLIEGKYHREG